MHRSKGNAMMLHRKKKKNDLIKKKEKKLRRYSERDINSHVRKQTVKSSNPEMNKNKII